MERKRHWNSRPFAAPCAAAALFGDARWQARTARRLSLESTLPHEEPWPRFLDRDYFFHSNNKIAYLVNVFYQCHAPPGSMAAQPPWFRTRPCRARRSVIGDLPASHPLGIEPITVPNQCIGLRADVLWHGVRARGHLRCRQGTFYQGRNTVDHPEATLCVGFGCRKFVPFAV